LVVEYSVCSPEVKFHSEHSVEKINKMYSWQYADGLNR
jgi:hypothetical protein